MGEIEVISSCLVGTTRDFPRSRLELNSWDLMVLDIVYTQRGLLFQNPNSQLQTLIDNLKNSLSKTLDFFPPLAGRLVTTAYDGDMQRFFIDSNNAGAEFSHAVANAISVSDVLEFQATPEFISSFFPYNGVYNYEGVSNPLLAVQVTELADGVFLGFATNHAVMDGASLWHFINSWSEISRGRDSISKLPVFERWFPTADDYMNRLVHLPTVKERASLKHSPLAPKIFHFSRESSAALKARANSEAGTDKISTLQAVVAHLWRSTTRCGSTGEESRSILMAIGARARLPLPDGYFGNALYSALLTMSEAELLHRGLGYSALKINEFVAQQTREAAIRSSEKGLKLGPAPPTLKIASSPRYDVYGNDFGWGKPVAVRSGSNRASGMVRASAAAEAGGMDLEVYLAKEMLEALENDQEFMAAVTIT